MTALIMWIIVSAILTILAWRKGQRLKVCLLLLGFWVVMLTLSSIAIALPVTDAFLRWTPGPMMMIQWWLMWELSKRTPKVQEIIKKYEEWKKKRAHNMDNLQNPSHLIKLLGRYLKRVFIDNLRCSGLKEERKVDLSKRSDLDEYEGRLRTVCESLCKEDHLLKFETSRHNESIHFTISFHI